MFEHHAEYPRSRPDNPSNLYLEDFEFDANTLLDFCRERKNQKVQRPYSSLGVEKVFISRISDLVSRHTANSHFLFG
jgi:hypothetical protein